MPKLGEFFGRFQVETADSISGSSGMKLQQVSVSGDDGLGMRVRNAIVIGNGTIRPFAEE